MNIEITIANKKGRFNAKGIYDGRQVIVQKGGYINPSFSTCIKGGNLSKKYRSDSAFVSDSFEIPIEYPTIRIFAFEDIHRLKHSVYIFHT